ncbi:efflux RND transporter permease subunit [Gayadomonas joobiniege]|uniref:efflux RND transporter permease subunit n=1 Tax=Gayadomonas joobiniege TaxID=1234606 RepID=UPI000360D137|nr:MMPL family transporter [Gayadomonas joobiniege]
MFFAPDNKQLATFEQMEARFSKNDNVSIIIVPQSANVYTPESLAIIQEVTEAAWQIPFSTRVDSLTNFQHTEAEQDDLLVRPLVDEFQEHEISVQQAKQIEQIALNEPSLINRIVAPDGSASMVNVTVHLPDDLQKTANIIQVAEFARGLKSKIEKKYSDHKVYLSGIVMLNNSLFEEALKDIFTLVPVMFLLIMVLLVILLRSLWLTLATVTVITFAVFSTMGFAGWIAIQLTIATISVPTVVMTLAVADSVHVIVSTQYFLAQGKDKTSAILAALKSNLSPIFITSATTAVGFLTFNFSDVPPLVDLGNLVALGVMLAFIFSVTVLPSLLYFIPIDSAKSSQVRQQNLWMQKYAQWVIKHYRHLLPVTSIGILALSGLIFLNRINDVPTDYFDKNIKFRQAADFSDEHLTGMTMLGVALDTGTGGGINSPNFLAKVEQFAIWIRKQHDVDHVETLSDTYKRLNKNMHGDLDEYYRLPESQPLAAQFLLLYEMSLPYGLDLNNQLNIDKSSIRLTIAMDNLGSSRILELESMIHQWFKTNAPEVEVTTSSPSLMFAHIGQANMQSMLVGSVLALVLISVLLIFALKSIRYGCISLIPNLVPAAIGFGIWGLFHGQINLGLSVVTSLCLGIVVDDTVHFLKKYKLARDQGNNAQQAVEFAFASVGRALWITTLVLASGFFVLAQSDFALNGDMGLLTALIIVIALVVDFIFLPAFLLLFDKKHAASEVSDYATNK